MDRYSGFAEFVGARQMALSRTAYLLTGDHHAAQDLVQAALVKTAAHWPRVLAGGDPEAYVRRVMVNENISGWRRRVPRPVETVPVGGAVMPALADLLADLAEEARPYGDAASAIRTVRGRRRRRDLLAATGASATGLLLVLAGLLGPAALNIWPEAGPSGHSRVFPAGPVPLLADAPLMPPGQPVGPASFLRVRVDPGGVQINVVLPDGRQYRIDRPHTPGRQQSVTLSPNGRYVVWTAPTGPVLRDLLTGDDLPVVAPEQFQGWSPDSFWLLGTERNGQLLVLANPLFGESHAFGPSEEAPLDVLNDGRLLLLAGYRLDGLIPMMVSDPLHSAVPAAFTVDAAPYLSPGQTVAVHTPQVSRIPHWVGAGAYGHAVMAINCADTGPNCGLLVFSR